LLFLPTPRHRHGKLSDGEEDGDVEGDALGDSDGLVLGKPLGDMAANPFALRWAVNVEQWEPEEMEWRFLLGLIPQDEMDAVLKCVRLRVSIPRQPTPAPTPLTAYPPRRRDRRSRARVLALESRTGGVYIPEDLSWGLRRSWVGVEGKAKVSGISEAGI